ncbi:uncharacterized protein CEXT_501181 [Caerostris extrusa]|uniref:Uncharacterized protein n=1 Tax=Caerostris extrusa TaxID=172846 RepID=A0AAV4RXW7_CAEEX|nr:uncharacterized protein CEXT_501181 [Caerostris extrusa]
MVIFLAMFFNHLCMTLEVLAKNIHLCLNSPHFQSSLNFFPEHKDPFPNFHEGLFPTLPPEVKRHWQPLQPPSVPSPPQRPSVDEKFEGPLKNYDVVLGHTRYPKIFRFNEEKSQH